MNDPNYKDALHNVLYNFNHFPPKHVATATLSPAPRRAAVAAVMRIRPQAGENIENLNDFEFAHNVANFAGADEVARFLKEPWVKRGTPEILFIKRATRPNDQWSGHVAFPGGKSENQETLRETAERETLEEIGLDLKTGFMAIGELDERKIVTTLGGNLLMILSSFVYLQTTPATAPMKLSTAEVHSAHWIPIATFFDHLHAQNERPYWSSLQDRTGYGPIYYNMLATAHPASKNWNPLLRKVAHRAAGKIYFWSVALPMGDATYSEKKVQASKENGKRAAPAPRHTNRFLVKQNLSESIVLVSESSEDDVIAMSSDDDEFLSKSRSERSISNKNKSTKVIADEKRQVNVLPAADHTDTRLTLWGLTLSVTSELLDMMHRPTEVPHVPLRGGHPIFDYWEVNQILSLVNWAADLSNGRRKPAGTQVATQRPQPHHHFHVNPAIVIPTAFAISGISRVVIAVIASKMIWKGGKKLLSSML